MGCKFKVQNLLHEPEVLPVSFANLVACMNWTHAKGPKEPIHILQTTLPQFLLICHMGLAIPKRNKYSTIHKLDPHRSWACRKYVTKIGINTC